MIAKHDWVWFILRIAVAWMYLFPVPGLVADWDATTLLTRLVSGIFVNFLSVLGIFLMVLGAISILFGIYAQIGGIFLFVYTLIGIRVHFRLAQVIASRELPDICRAQGGPALGDVKSLGVLGQITSGQKNVVLAAVALAFVILGSGSISLTANLW
jgi:hypothetical protein